MSKGFTLWFTGLSGSGKTTLSRIISREIAARGIKMELFDGDVVRENLTKGLGFSKEDRDENVKRIGFVCQLLTRNEVAAVTAAISPYEDARELVRKRVGDFVLVFCKCDLDTLVARDPKGLYKRALAGEIPNFTGVSDPYEEPVNPDVVVDTAAESEEESVSKILGKLEALGFLPKKEVSANI